MVARQSARIFLQPKITCLRPEVPRERNMATKLEDLLPTASDFMKKLALAEAEEASKQAAKLAEAEAEKQALLDHFTKPSGVSDEEGIRRGLKIIERAVSNG